jgi:hypothetical protein
MTEVLTGVLIGAFGVASAVLLLRSRRRGQRTVPAPLVYSSIQEMRSLRQLSVFKILTKEIVTADEHCFGDIGRRYFNWMVSSRKMAMILTFNIDFRYDLQSADFNIRESPEGSRCYTLSLPKCFYETHITDISFYDEQEAKLLPWLLPDLINRAFGTGFSERDKNRLIEEAKHQATVQAEELVQRMRSDVQSSAQRTLEALARAFGAREVVFDFSTADLVQAKIEYEAQAA